MTQQKHTKKARCCGCFAWLFARWKHCSASEEPDLTEEQTSNASAQDDAGEQGHGSLALVCLKNAAQRLAVVEEGLPSDTLQDADGVVGKAGKGAAGRSPQTLTITIHLVKRERLHKPLDGPTVADRRCTQVQKVVRLNFQHLNYFFKVRELYCRYNYFKHGFPLSSIPSELQKPKERTVRPQKQPAREAVNKLPEPHKTGILKKGKTASTAHKCVRFNFQNLNTFVKDRELYCGYDYFKYGFPLSSIRSQLQKPKERTVKPQEEPAREAANKLPQPPKTVTEEARDSGNKNPEPEHLTGILKKGKTARTAHKCVRFDFQNLNTWVKGRELYCGYDYSKYGFPLSDIRSQLHTPKERTVKPQEGPGQDAVNRHNSLHQQTVAAAACTPNVTSRPHHQPVRSASNSLRGAPRHLGRQAQRSHDSFQQSSGRNAAHNYTNSRDSQHRQHNTSSHVSPRFETRNIYEAQAPPGTNSRSRRRAKRGAKPSDGDVLEAPGEYTAS